MKTNLSQPIPIMAMKNHRFRYNTALSKAAARSPQQLAGIQKTEPENRSAALVEAKSFNGEHQPLESPAPVAQLDRVPGYELGGRTFESCRVRHTEYKYPIKTDGYIDYSLNPYT